MKHPIAARLLAWLWGIKLPDDEAIRRIKREEAIDQMARVDHLEIAIDTIANAMPNGNGNQINGPVYDDIERRKEMLRHMVNGGSVIYAVDWEWHPSHCVVATTQPNGRALMTIHEQSYLLKKGSQ